MINVHTEHDIYETVINMGIRYYKQVVEPNPYGGNPELHLNTFMTGACSLATKLHKLNLTPTKATLEVLDRCNVEVSEVLRHICDLTE